MWRVLIADDERLVIASLMASVDWAALDLEVIGTCGDGMQALAKIRALNPNIVMTDIRMPGLNGLELMKAARAECPDVQFIVLSGHADFSYAREAIRQEAVEYLLKPFEEEEIRSALCKAKGRLERREGAGSGERERPVSAHSEKLEMVLAYIERNYQKSISLNSTASALFISPNYISQLFRKEMDTTFTQYLAEKKMRCACELLRDPSRSVGDVARELGFSDYFYFIRVFKKIVGKSPGSYQSDEKG